MAEAFSNVRNTAKEASIYSTIDQNSLLRELDERQKAVLTLFAKSKFITTKDVATHLGLHIRTSLNLCNSWCASGFVVRHGTGPKNRKYELADAWLELI